MKNNAGGCSLIFIMLGTVWGLIEAPVITLSIMGVIGLIIAIWFISNNAKEKERKQQEPESERQAQIAKQKQQELLIQLQKVREHQRKIDEQKAQIERQKQELLEQFGIKYLYHITHIDNLDNILQNGLKSHNYARQNHLLKNDIADNEVNSRRSKQESIYRRSLHDYVPFYFNPKNPMLFRRKISQNEIVILAIDKMQIYNDNTLFTDGNAASSPTNFYNNVQDLNKLNWDCIFANKYWNDFTDGKREKCSEILIYPDVSVQSIKKIFCNNYSIKQTIERKIVELSHIQSEMNLSLYF